MQFGPGLGVAVAVEQPTEIWVEVQERAVPGGPLTVREPFRTRRGQRAFGQPRHQCARKRGERVSRAISSAVPLSVKILCTAGGPGRT